MDKQEFTAIAEGGLCRRIYTSPRGERPLTTAIEYILPAGGLSALHTLDADELWIHVGGGRLRTVCLWEGEVTERELGPGEHRLFPAGSIFGARETAGEDARVICVVSPGYTDEGFRLVSLQELPALPEGPLARLRGYVKKSAQK